ncbi:aldo/keto reductase [Salinimicrobium sediminilitoris]|uniref:aldo/keto reductase n=1 Tax=Salinimicrobium sediminilitoris TaxID=2876715 RepID=UPI001E5C1CA9|nr:aldo/keto reductase [Salinimicrobium sediminilitoris]MCC8359401.1 aldo/keto reductase [Salinimicrobium sediminilitoris]
MRQRNSYSRIIQDPEDWEELSKGNKIQLFQHCVEKGITTFLIDLSKSESYSHSLGTAFSESGLSRDQVQLIACPGKNLTTEQDILDRVEKILNLLDTDYLDLLILDFDAPSEIILSSMEKLRARGKIVEVGVLKRRTGEKMEFLKDFPASATLSTFSFTPSAVKSLTLAEAASSETTQMIIPESGDWENEHEALKTVANKYNLRPKEMLLAWLLHHKAQFHAVIKGNSQAVIDSAYKAFHTSIIEEDFKKLPEKL